jgi:hypothetical protein
MNREMTDYNNKLHSQPLKKVQSELNDNTKPTKTDSCVKKNPFVIDEEDKDDDNHEVFEIEPEKLKKLWSVPKVNPRLRIIKQEEHKISGSFGLSGANASSIQPIDEGKIEFPSVGEGVKPIPEEKEGDSPKSSSEENAHSITLTEFHQYNDPNGRIKVLLTYID